MPYAGASDKSLPANVKAMPKAKRAQWVAIFNRQIAAKKPESSAFQLANGVVMGKTANAGGAATSETKTTPAKETCDPEMESSDPGVSGVHVDSPIGAVKPIPAKRKGKGATYLMHLVNQMKGKYSAEEYSAMVTKARAHAGGMGKAGKSASDWDADSDVDDDDGPDVLFEKSDERIQYKAATSATERCGMCAFFDNDGDADNANGPCCQLVEGVIGENNVCNLFMNDPMEASEDSLTAIVRTVDQALRSSFMINGGTDYDNRQVSQFYYSQEIFPDYVVAQSRVDSYLYKIPFTYSATEGVKFGEPVKVKQEYVVATEVADLCARGNGKRYQLFNEIPVQEFADPPDWIPYLPKPGSYKHPKYGAIKITKARNKNFVTQFKDGVYQSKLPVDTEHQLSLSGAVAWIDDMRQNADGSADAHVEWTDRGKTLIEGDQYKYFSPAWFDKWTDPATSKDYKDIAIGGAITVRPFFKEGSLRPLVASESGELFANEQRPAGSGKTEIFYFSAFMPSSRNSSTEEKDMAKTTSMVDCPDCGGTGKVDGKTCPMCKGSGEVAKKASETGAETETESRFAELESKATAAEKRASEAEATLKTLTEQKAATEATVKTLSEKIEAQEKAARTLKFTSEVKGKTDNGRPWVGKHEDHVQFLEDLADKFGEDSDQVKRYIALNRDASERLEQAGLFSETGSLASGATNGTAIAKINAKAAELQKLKPNVTFEQAFTEVINADPKLYAEYEAEAN